jgi:hypothetical protein
LNTIPKSHRYSLGQRIDTLLVEAIESISVASFSISLSLKSNPKLGAKEVTGKMDRPSISQKTAAVPQAPKRKPLYDF